MCQLAAHHHEYYLHLLLQCRCILFPLSFLYGYVLHSILIFASGACFYIGIHRLHLACDYEHYLFSCLLLLVDSVSTAAVPLIKVKLNLRYFVMGVSVIIYYSLHVIHISFVETDGAKKLTNSFVAGFRIRMLKGAPRNWFEYIYGRLGFPLSFYFRFAFLGFERKT